MISREPPATSRMMPDSAPPLVANPYIGEPATVVGTVESDISLAAGRCPSRRWAACWNIRTAASCESKAKARAAATLAGCGTIMLGGRLLTRSQLRELVRERRQRRCAPPPDRARPARAKQGVSMPEHL